MLNVKFLFKVMFIIMSFSQWSLQASELAFEQPSEQLCQGLNNLRNNVRLLFVVEQEVKQKLNIKSLNHLKKFCKDSEVLSPTMGQKILSAPLAMYCDFRIKKYQNWGLLLLHEYTSLIRLYRNFLEKNKDQLSPIAFGLLYSLDNEDPENTIFIDISDLSEAGKDSYLFLDTRLFELRGIKDTRISGYEFESSQLRERLANKNLKTNIDYLNLSSKLLIDDNPFGEQEHPFIEDLDMFSRTMCQH